MWHTRGQAVYPVLVVTELFMTPHGDYFDASEAGPSGNSHHINLFNVMSYL